MTATCGVSIHLARANVAFQVLIHVHAPVGINKQKYTVNKRFLPLHHTHTLWAVPSRLVGQCPSSGGGWGVERFITALVCVRSDAVM